MTNRRIASELTKIAKMLVAIDFPNQQAMDKYLKDHPKANKSNHKVVQNKSPTKTPQQPAQQVENKGVLKVEQNPHQEKIPYIENVIGNFGSEVKEDTPFSELENTVISELVKSGLDRQRSRKTVYEYHGTIKIFLDQKIPPVDAVHISVALNHYIEDGYKEINSFLYDKNTSKRAEESVQWIDKAITSAPPNLINNNGVVYRGTPMRLSEWEKFKVGAVVTMPSFFSTTTDLEVATQFSDYDFNHQIQIKQDPNAPKPERRKAIVFVIKKPKHFGLNLSNIGDHTDESEVLLPRNTKFRIDSIVEGEDYGTKVNVTIVP